ncbi:MAG: HAD hydrolase-like protein [Planctomycetota bacterium]
MDRPSVRFGSESTHLVVFDLDGTILDSLPDIAGGLNAVRRNLGFEPLPLPSVKRGIGKGAKVLIERTMTDVIEAGATPEKLYERFMVEYRVHSVAQPRLYPFADEFMMIAEQTAELAVLTNKPLEITERTLEALDLTDRFVSVLAPENCRAPKPDPVGLLDLLDERGVAHDAALLIGDSSNDFGAGRRAEVPTVGMRHGYHDHQPPEPDLWVDDFEALLDLWHNPS